ncbi:MAG: hypothetical protein P0Y64_16715 [Candidatus Sphingomonas colombiensis]|nr:hypothetical protein [Sphingomonas sp.]WEK42962.1 MAG: hypothetical protein P0Y64_16715 [Sphingomonas sp.]
MNAPARITPLRLVQPDETEAEAAYRRSISIHCPEQDEVTMAARVALAMMRDKAALGIAKGAKPSAAVLLHEVNRIAAIYVFAPAKTSELMRVGSALNFTIEAARALERAVPDGR